MKTIVPVPFGAAPCATDPRRNYIRPAIIALLLVLVGCPGIAGAQDRNARASAPANSASIAMTTPDATATGALPAPTPAATPTPAARKEGDALTERERLLLDRVEQLERRLVDLETREQTRTAGDAVMSERFGTIIAADGARAAASQDGQNSNPQNQGQLPNNTGRVGAADPRQVSDDDRTILDFFKRTTINATVDGYYGYNFNRPVGGINLLRAYDVQSNSFSLNQAAVIIERAPDLEANQRFGLRLDLQYGQATETVQGNPVNEPRPQAFRNVWQAYGTYVAPIGKGVTVDFGKFAGSLGYETNYTKDNFNYSRSYFFNFLPFYHFGFRTTYSPNDKVTLQNWIVNGANQSEDFNGFKSTAFLLTYKPTKRITSQFNYYVGQEQRDRNPALNPTFAPVASQPGLSIDVIRPVPDGRFHVLDTYSTFNVTDKLTLALEADYVIGRFRRDGDPSTVYGGAGYARYQFTPKFAAAGRFEYLQEKAASFGGLFTGVNQALKEGTLTAEYKFADGFLGRAEYRRDYSNVPYFLTEQSGVLKKEQNTATLGLVFWIGRKQGTW